MTIQPKFPAVTQDLSQLDDDGARNDAFQLDLNEILRIVQSRLYLIIACVVAAAIMAGAFLYTSTPLYSAGAQILLGDQGRANTTVTDLVSGVTVNSTIIEGELAVIESSAILGRVAQKLNLDEDPEFNWRLREISFVEKTIRTAKNFVKNLVSPPPPPRLAKDSAMAAAANVEDDILKKYGSVIGAIRERMRARQVGRAFVVSITLTTEQPQKSSAIANTIADEYIAYRREEKFNSVQRISDWLDQRLSSLEQDVETAENNVLELRARIVADDDTSEIVQKQVSELTTKLVSARAELAEAEARYRQFDDIIRVQGIQAAGSLVSSGLLNSGRLELAKLRREEQAINDRFGADSAKSRSQRSAIEAVEREIEREVERLLTQEKNAVEIARAGVDSLAAGLRDLERRAVERSRDLVKLRQLTRVADANRLIYEEFLNRFKEAREVQNLQEPDADVISYAAPRNTPSSPKVMLTLILALMAGGCMGVGAAFLLELRQAGFLTTDELRKRTGLMVLGRFTNIGGGLPRIGQSAKEILAGAGARLDPTLAHEARNLRSYLQFGFDQAIGAIMVTSSAPAEGKTTTVRLLGWAAAQTGKTVLLVDADLSRQSLSRGWRRDGAPDLVSVLTKEATIDEALRFDEATQCYMLPATQMIEDHAALLDGPAVADLMKKLKDRFDVVLVDTPPLLELSDALAFVKHVDLTLFAVRWRKTPAASAQRSLRILRSVGLRTAAAVMTFVDQKAGRYGEYEYDNRYLYRKDLG